MHSVYSLHVHTFLHVIRNCFCSKVLWPYLLEFIVPEQYTRGFAMLTRCIHHIASKKRAEEAEDYEIDFDVAGMVLRFIYIL